MDYICSTNIDLFALIETWFNDFDTAVKAECVPDGYKLSEKSRPDRMGGCIALIYRNDISVKKIEIGSRDSFEVSEFAIASDSRRARLAVVYRPPSCNRSRSIGTFFIEFAEYVESFIMNPEPIIISGYFNFLCG